MKSGLTQPLTYYNRNVVYYGVILEPLFSSDKKAVLEETSTLQSDVNDVSAIIFATENDAPQPLDIKGKSWTISSYGINERYVLSSHILLI